MTFTYRAFISYSHTDSGVARWLHGELEAYRVPARLVGRETATGVIGSRIGKVFRDRDELPVSADLSGAINDALGATQFLVVMCSPSSARSKWVNQEVINFKRLKGADSIIAVIVDGEPYASAKPGREADECFVPALRFKADSDGNLTNQPAEPIAADLRPGKDGKRLVKLKVLAGLLCVGLDELVQRDAARRHRVMMGVTAATGAIAATMAALAIAAVLSRNQAEDARATAEARKQQAESLVEFMLGDLRAKLEPVGRLDLLESVGQRALEYFRELRTDETDNDSMARRARALGLLGEINDLRGNLNEAVASFEAASATTAAMLAGDPNDGARLRNHAVSLERLGAVHLVTGDLDQASKNFEASATYAGRAVAASPGHAPTLAVLAGANRGRGTVFLRRGQVADAIGAFQEAQREYDRAISFDAADGRIRLEAANNLGWLSNAYLDNGDTPAARDARVAQLRIFDSLGEKDINNTQVIEPRMVALRMLGLFALDGGDATAAIGNSRQALALANKLTATDSSNLFWVEMLARCRIDLAEGLFDSGALQDAARELAQALTIVDGLFAAERGPPPVTWQLTMDARARVLGAKIMLASGDRAGAAQNARDVATRLKAVTASNPDEARAPVLLADALTVHAFALNPDDAEREGLLKLAQDSLDRFGGPKSLEERGIAVRILAARGDLKAASSAITALISDGYRRKEIADLGKSLGVWPE